MMMAPPLNNPKITKSGKKGPTVRRIKRHYKAHHSKYLQYIVETFTIAPAGTSNLITNPSDPPLLFKIFRSLQSRFSPHLGVDFFFFRSQATPLSAAKPNLSTATAAVRRKNDLDTMVLCRYLTSSSERSSSACIWLVPFACFKCFGQKEEIPLAWLRVSGTPPPCLFSSTTRFLPVSYSLCCLLPWASTIHPMPLWSFC